MDSNNERDTRAVFGSKSDGNAKVFKFMDLLPDRKTDDVPDPYYTGNFDEVYELISLGCERLAGEDHSGPARAFASLKIKLKKTGSIADTGQHVEPVFCP